MMAALEIPKIRGRVQEKAVLGPTTWFRVGGAAEFLVRPADAADLGALLRELAHEMPVMVIGATSNVIIRDRGIAGVVIKLARGFNEIVIEPDGIVAGAAALDVTVAEHAAAAALSGLEFLSGIPGTIGGAVAMNAGAYGGDVSQVLQWAEIVTRSGELVRLNIHDLGLSYRRSNLPPGAVVTRAKFSAVPGEPQAIAARMAEIKASREATQPVRARTGGSTFANPPDMKAWELIDAAGCRGFTRGRAKVSELHCNFLLNLGDATAAELEGLGEVVREKVRQTSGVSLHWEIKRIGIPA
jgi:UDP-N-acetylmuramate dehydrogenase